MTPWLTDISAVAYASYYFIPVVLIVILYFWGTEEEFTVTTYTLLLGYYLSYAGYIAMPTIGTLATPTANVIGTSRNSRRAPMP